MCILLCLPLYSSMFPPLWCKCLFFNLFPTFRSFLGTVIFLPIFFDALLLWFPGDFNFNLGLFIGSIRRMRLPLGGHQAISYRFFRGSILSGGYPPCFFPPLALRLFPYGVPQHRTSVLTPQATHTAPDTGFFSQHISTPLCYRPCSFYQRGPPPSLFRIAAT